MPTSPVYGLRYPAPADPADVPSDLQKLTSDIESLIGNLKSYTPTWTAATTNPVLGNGTLVGQWAQVGKIIVFNLTWTAGSTTTFGAGPWRFGIPGPVAAGQTRQIGFGFGYDSSTGNMVQVIVDGVPGGSDFGPSFGAAYLGALTPVASTAPWAWANGDIMRISGVYLTA